MRKEEVFKQIEQEKISDPFKVFSRYYKSFYFPGFAHFRAGIPVKNFLFPLLGLILIGLIITLFTVYNTTSSLHKTVLRYSAYNTGRFATTDESLDPALNDITSFLNNKEKAAAARNVFTTEKHLNNMIRVYKAEVIMGSNVDSMYEGLKPLTQLSDKLARVESDITSEFQTRLEQDLSAAERSDLIKTRDNRISIVKKAVQDRYCVAILDEQLKKMPQLDEELIQAEMTILEEFEASLGQDGDEQDESKLIEARDNKITSIKNSIRAKYEENFKKGAGIVFVDFVKTQDYLVIYDKYMRSSKRSLLLFIACIFIFLAFWLYTSYDFIRILNFGQLNRMVAEVRRGLGFLSLNILGFMTFTLGPVLYSLYLSFNEWDILTDMVWVGLANFKRLFSDPLFWKYLGNTFFFFIGIPMGMTASLLLAMAMNQKIRGITFFRVLFYLPVVSSIVAVALLWRWIYNPDFGLLNSFLRGIGIDDPPTWLSSTTWAKPAITIMEIWKGMGYGMLLYLAALQGIPPHLYEAAEIDGAGKWHQFRYITLPLLGPTHFFNIIMGVIGTFQAFGSQYVMTQGGPAGSTTTIVYYIYNNAFKWFKMGYASSIAWVLFFMVFIVTIVNWRVAGKTLYTE